MHLFFILSTIHVSWSTSSRCSPLLDLYVERKSQLYCWMINKFHYFHKKMRQKMFFLLSFSLNLDTMCILFGDFFRCIWCSFLRSIEPIQSRRRPKSFSNTFATKTRKNKRQFSKFLHIFLLFFQYFVPCETAYRKSKYTVL